MKAQFKRPFTLTAVIVLIIGVFGFCDAGWSEALFDASRFSFPGNEQEFDRDIDRSSFTRQNKTTGQMVSIGLGFEVEPTAIAIVKQSPQYDDGPELGEDFRDSGESVQRTISDDPPTATAEGEPVTESLTDLIVESGGEDGRAGQQDETIASEEIGESVGTSRSEVTRLPEPATIPARGGQIEVVPTPPAETAPRAPRRTFPADELTPPVAGDFPRLPPAPESGSADDLPPLADELFYHGGSYLYQPEGDRLNWPSEDCGSHHELLRLPEDHEKPRPVEAFAEFLGVGPPESHPDWMWEGPFGYFWEPRFVGYGNYRVFGLAFEENNQEQYGIGHQLELELDLRLTGTERFHVQFKPIGFENRGGSFYQFNSPSGYIDNSRATPDRYWFEGELHSILGGTCNPFAALDYHFVIGRFPLSLHNSLLLNSDLLGVAVNKNTIFAGNLSNLNVQIFAAREDVAAFTDGHALLAGCNAFADWRHTYIEASYAYVSHEHDAARDAHYVALSATCIRGRWVFAARGLGKLGDEGGRGDGHLFVIESNRTRYFDQKPLGIEQGILYCNGFYASDGWNPIAGGNFDRLRSSFEVNPLVAISAGNPVSDNVGVALGVQLFRHHKDESIVPEFAIQSPMGVFTYGFGLRYQRKTGPRTFCEVLGNAAFSDDSTFDRRGVLVTHTLAF